MSTGPIRRVHLGVYATFTGPLPFAARVWATILRVGRGAAASHRTAAYLDGLCDDPGPVIHVTAPADRYVEPVVDGVRVHFAHRLPRTRHPSATPPRTRVEEAVLDLVDATPNPREAETWVTAACQRRLVTPERLADALGRRKKIRWRAMVEAMLVDVADAAQSPLELRHLRRVERAHGLPTGCRQRRVAGQRVTWIDVDGHATLRYGHADVFGNPCAVAAEQARVLSARGWTGRTRSCGPHCRAPPMIIKDRPRPDGVDP